MNKSNKWDLVLKILIAVISALAGAVGAQTMV
ncbi:MAG: smalltalk protein [Bacteroides sp.]|nr:smalltalk protein [Bacteroides sp.]